MSQPTGRLPIGIGDREAQVGFIERNQAFLSEYEHLRALLEKVALRTLEAPTEAELQPLLALQDDHPDVVEFEDKQTADRVVFGLGRIAIDDFSELLILAGNGHGIGALKILRGIYERVVTAVYVGSNISEARVFAEETVIKKWKLWQQALKVTPDIEKQVAAEKIKELEAEYNRVRTKQKQSFCKACGQPKTREAWTRVDLGSMSKKVNMGLDGLYGPCYLEPTFHSHATGYGVGARFRHTGDSIQYQQSSETEARLAMNLGHHLMLILVSFQNEYFNLRLGDELKQRAKAFLDVWGCPG